MSSSKSSSSQKSDVTDRRIGATEGAIVVAEGASADLTSVISQTDGGAVQSAAEALSDGIAEVVDLGKAALGFSGEVVDESLGTVRETVGDAFVFSADVADDAFGLVDSTNVEANKRIETAIKAQNDIAGQAIGSVLSATRNDVVEPISKLINGIALVGTAAAIAFAVRK